MTKLNRKTKETNIECIVDINGSGKSSISTGIGFFDHMLEAMSKHSGIDITLKCQGDLHVDGHHSVEDCAIVLGKALKKEIFPIEKIERYSNCTIVMDEAAINCAIDLSNRGYLIYQVNVSGVLGTFDTQLAKEFFYALVINCGITAHIIQERGQNKHHILEGCFKAFGVCLRKALIKNEKLGVPSTKGIL